MIDAFLDSRIDFETVPIAADELPAGFAPGPSGRLRILPGTIEAEGGTDSFFIARMRRR